MDALDNRGESAAKSLVYSLLTLEPPAPGSWLPVPSTRNLPPNTLHPTPLSGLVTNGGPSCILATRNPDSESFLHL